MSAKHLELDTAIEALSTAGYHASAAEARVELAALLRSTEALRSIADPEHCLTQFANTDFDAADGLRQLARAALGTK